ncbi:hypothetical protein FRC01_012018, partial [Tulasnella sp. 417]
GGEAQPLRFDQPSDEEDSTDHEDDSPAPLGGAQNAESEAKVEEDSPEPPED